MNSPFVGVLASAIANLTKHELLPLLSKLMLTTANVDAGQVYTVVYVPAATSLAPNLPLAILFLHVYCCR